MAIAGIITAASAQPPKATTPKPTTSPTATKPVATAKPAASATATKPAATGTTAASTATAPVAVKTKPTALGNQVRAAAAGFQPIAAGAVAQSKVEVQQAVAVLDAYLRSLGDWEAPWKDYLFWNQMTAELAKLNNYDIAALMRVQRRYSGGFVGLEEPEFRAVGDALVKFAHLADAAQNAKLAEEYKSRLGALADVVDAVGNGAPTAAQSAAIAENMAWLDARGQAPQVIELIGTKYSQPNLLIDVSETFVVEALSRPVDQTEPVVDCILGTYITGTGRTIGEVNVDVVPNGEQAELVTYLSGINYSRTVGHNRSALIYSQGATTLNGQSTLYVNEQGLAGGPISTSARVNNRITGYGSTKGGLIGNLVKKIAAKKAPQQKAQGERIAAAHARVRLARSMQKEIVQQIAQANEELEARLRRPLQRFGQYPAQLKYASTDDSLTIRALQTTSGRLAAPGEAPALAGGAPVSVRVHRSLVTNSSQGMLAGRKFDQQRIQLLAESILGEVPERLKPQPGQEPFSITFADTDPVLLSFDGDKANFTIRGKAFTSGDKKFDGMNISGVYKLSSDGHGLKAVREGEFDIVPPDFVRGKDKLNTRQIVLKRILTEKFGKALPAEIVRTGEPVEGDESKGTIYVSSLKASGDWLVLGLKRDPAAAAQAAGAQAEAQ